MDVAFALVEAIVRIRYVFQHFVTRGSLVVTGFDKFIFLPISLYLISESLKMINVLEVV